MRKFKVEVSAILIVNTNVGTYCFDDLVIKKIDLLKKKLICNILYKNKVLTYGNKVKKMRLILIF